MIYRIEFKPTYNLDNEVQAACASLFNIRDSLGYVTINAQISSNLFNLISTGWTRNQYIMEFAVVPSDEFYIVIEFAQYIYWSYTCAPQQNM